MYLEYTIYPPRTEEDIPRVGFYVYNCREEKSTIGGAPGIPLAAFDKIIEGTSQYNDFLAEVRKLGLTGYLAA